MSPFPFEICEASTWIQSSRSRLQSAVIELPVILLEFNEAVIEAGLIVMLWR
jgi:hypothetical protein